jgi:hypothetical protein
MGGQPVGNGDPSDGAVGATPPGTVLAGLLTLAAGSGERYPGRDDGAVITAAGRWDAVESWAGARKLASIRELIRRNPAGAPPAAEDKLPGAWRCSLIEEIACELAITKNAADALLGLAHALEARLPLTAAALDAGVLSLSKARMIAEETSVLSDEDAGKAEALAAPMWAGKTWGQIRDRIARAVVEVDPDGARKRREQAERHDARVRFWREHAGTAGLAGSGLPTDRTLAAMAAVQNLARAYKRYGIPETMQLLRVRALLDLLTGTDSRTQYAKAAGSPGKAGAAAGRVRGTADEEPAGEDPHRNPRPGPPAADRPAPDADRLFQGALSTWDAEEAEDGDAGRDNADSDSSSDGIDHDDGDADHDGNDGDADRDNTDSDSSSDGIDHDDGNDGDADGGDADGDGADGDGEPDGDGDADGDGDGGPGDNGGPSGTGPGPAGGGAGLAANVDLTIPLGTLLGLAERPGVAHGLGVLDPDLARRLAALAAGNPASTFRVILTDDQGQAIGYGQARRIMTRRDKQGRAGGQRDGPPAIFTPATFTPAGTTTSTLPGMPGDAGPPGAGSLGGAGAPGGYGTWTLAIGDLLLPVSLAPIPDGECDHRLYTPGYRPGEELRRLVEVRDGECTLPVCSRAPRRCEFDHAIPWPQGPTCACNGGCRCSHDHHVKHSPGWKIEQLPGGRHRWTTPSGKTYTKGPKQYPILELEHICS